MPSKGSDAAQKAQEATYVQNAKDAREQSKRGIDQMFEGVQDFSTQGTTQLASATAMLGKMGYIDKNQYHLPGGTRNFGRTNLDSDVESISGLNEKSVRKTEIQADLDKYEERTAELTRRGNNSTSDNDRSNNSTNYGAQAAKELGIDPAALKKELGSITSDIVGAREVKEYIDEKGGISSIQGVATSKGTARAMGSALDAVMKAKSTMVRDRSKLINMGITSSYDASRQGKFFTEAAKYANEAAEYARAQSAWNNFMSMTSSALTIVALL